ncbi:hypothetical protein JTE90_014192, partial [Oedothorax gibbosus]
YLQKSKFSCKMVRENFDCVMWQTSACLDKQGQDESRDVITRLWRHLQSFCEDEGTWYTKACFQREELRRCEALLPPKGYSTDDTACRSFSSFRECATSAIQSGCSRSDVRLLGTYLMEKGGQRAWNCPKDARYAARQVSSQDTYYSSGDCNEESRDSIKSCRSTFDSDRREATNRNDQDMRHHKTCCALVTYEECVERALKCRGDGARSEARALVSEMRQRLPYEMDSCGDHTAAECSAAPGILAGTASLLVVVLTLLL